jgi:hypothetical protein
VYVEVKQERAARTVSLEDEEDLTSFSVRVPSSYPRDQVALSLSTFGAGRLLDNEAAINVEWLRACTAEKSAEWQNKFDGMLAYASTRGWMDAEGTTVMAHIEEV